MFMLWRKRPRISQKILKNPARRILATADCFPCSFFDMLKLPLIFARLLEALLLRCSCLVASLGLGAEMRRAIDTAEVAARLAGRFN